jgi:hypothetical protein
LNLNGNDGQGSEFERSVAVSATATYRERAFYCDYSIFVPGIKAGRWRIWVGLGVWSTFCERDFPPNTFANEKFRQPEAGCL